MITVDTINYAFHSIQVIDNDGHALDLTAAGHVQIADGGNSITVDAVQLDIDDLDSGTDSVSAVQSGVWNIGTVASITADVNIADGGNSITVDAIDLDIRDLTSVSDSVSAVQSGVWDIGTLTGITNDVNIADGGNSITVDAVQLDIDDLIYTTDSVTAHQGGSWMIEQVSAGYDTWQVSAVSVTNAATQIGITPLADRLYCEIQNLGPADIYIEQDNGVAVAAGLKISKGSSQSIGLDAGAAIWGITPSGTADIRLAEYSA